MNTINSEFGATNKAALPGGKRGQNGSIRISIAILLVASALVAALGWVTAADHDAAPAAVPQTAFSSMSVPLSATEGSSVNTEYFPAQFKNQSRRTTPEEHIQAY